MARAGAPARSWLAILVAATAMAFAASWLAICVVDIDSTARVNHVVGAQLALGEWLADGVLYPDFFDGAHTGGTRFFPLPIALLGGLTATTGSVVSSAKFLSALAMLGIGAFVFAAARRFGNPRSVSLGLAALAPSTAVAQLLAFSGRFDGWGTLLAIGSLVALDIDGRRRDGRVVSAVLAGLAVLSRPTTLWAPCAIALSLIARKRCWRFAIAFAAVVAAGAAATLIASDGRFAENLRLLFVGAPSAGKWPAAPLWLIESVGTNAPAILLFIPAALSTALGDRSPSGILWSLSWILCSLVTLYVLRAQGIGANHIIDFVAVSGVCFARHSAAVRAESNYRRAGQLALAAALLIATTATLRDLRDTLRAPSPSPSQLAHELAPPGSRVLAESPLIPVARGEHPVVLDAFMLPRLPGAKGSQARAFVVDSVHQQRFDRILLRKSLDEVEWYQQVHFGQAFRDAVHGRYRLQDQQRGFFVYVPTANP